jgi:Family of unknown function (DUF5989)
MSKHDDLKELASHERSGILAEFWDFLKENKKWWLLPIIAVIFLMGLLIFLSGSAAAPFIYTLF